MVIPGILKILLIAGLLTGYFFVRDVTHLTTKKPSRRTGMASINLNLYRTIFIIA